MAPKGTKRKAASTSAGRNVAPKTAAKPAADLSGVSNALAQADGFTASHAQLLARGTPSLGVYKDQRHRHEQNMVDMIGEVLSECEAKLRVKLHDAKEAVANAGPEKERREKALTDAEAALGSFNGAVEEKKAALDDAAANIVQAQKVVKETEAAKATADERHHVIADMKMKVEAMKALFSMAETSKISGRSPAQKIPRSFVKNAQEVGLDMKMISKLPDILAKEPEQRQEFDLFLMDKFGEALAKIAEVYGEAAVRAEEVNKESKTATVAAAKDEVTRAVEMKEECSKALVEAKAAVKAGHKSVEDAKTAIKHYQSDMQKAFDRQDKEAALLAAFKAGPMATYEELKDRTAPPQLAL